MPAKPVIAQDPDDPTKRYQLVNNAWVPLESPNSGIPKIDPIAFQDARASLEDLSQVEPKINPLNTGLLGRLPFNQSNVDLEGLIKPISSRGMIGRMMQLKAASPTGSTGFGALAIPEVELIKSTMGNLDTKQSTGQLKSQVGRVRELLKRSYQGLTPDNPIDLSKGQSRTLIPQGAYYKDPQGRLRVNQNFDKGNPIVDGSTDNKAARKKKYGLED